MDAVLAETSIGITELKKNPSAVIRDAGSDTIVVLHHNKPSAYLVPASTYEALMDVLDDLQLIPIVQERISSWQTQPSNVIEVTREELEKIARGTPQKPSKSRASSKPLAGAL
jgi:antitoxin StbD